MEEEHVGQERRRNFNCKVCGNHFPEMELASDGGVWIKCPNGHKYKSKRRIDLRTMEISIWP